MNLTFEQLVNFYISEFNKSRNIPFTRKIKNFEKYEKDRKHFDLAVNKLNQLNSIIDPQLFCRALTEYHKGYYQPSELCNLKSFRIYREYINSLTATDNPKLYEEKIKESLKFLINYLVENDISSLSDYYKKDGRTTPILVKHIYSGSLDYSFIACFDDISGIILSYPQDIVQEFLPNFSHKYIVIRVKLLENEQLRKFSENIRLIIGNLLRKERERKLETIPF